MRVAQAIKRRISEFELAESVARAKLLEGARAGDRDALAVLRTRYSLRLPLVEEAPAAAMPSRLP